MDIKQVLFEMTLEEKAHYVQGWMCGIRWKTRDWECRR